MIAPSPPPFGIAALRAELGLSLEAFGAQIGMASKGNVSILERGGACSLAVAIAIEALSGRRIDAAALNADVGKARASFLAADRSHANRGLAGAIADVARLPE